MMMLLLSQWTLLVPVPVPVTVPSVNIQYRAAGQSNPMDTFELNNIVSLMQRSIDYELDIEEGV